MVKPGFFRNEDLCALPFQTRLCFAGLWLCSDRDGRLEDRPKRLKADIFPYDDIDIDPLIQQLHDIGFVTRYVVESDRYIQINKFSRHQYPHHREPASSIPPISKGKALGLSEASPGQALGECGESPTYTETEIYTETERDLSKTSVIYTVAAPTNGNGRASRGSLSSDSFTNPQITERAGRFIERYETLYREHRKGARYTVRPVRDYSAAVTLCTTWDDDIRLDKLAVIFLNSDHKFAEEGSRTIPQFLALASWCDGLLAEHEAQNNGRTEAGPRVSTTNGTPKVSE